MGNHDVGRALVAGSKGFWAGRKDGLVTKDEALTVLDAMAEDFRGADAEFDDNDIPDSPLGRLVAIAFDATEEEITDGDAWYEGPWTRFSDRYGFC